MRCCACLLLVLASVAGGQGQKQDKEITLAVVVHAKNPIKTVSFAELRAYLKVERQFWPNKKRVELFLRPSRSLEMEILLSKIYRMSNDELRKYWVGKVFRGDITKRPAIVPNVAAARSRVLKVTGAMTVVLADEIPEGVRVLTIGGKKPSDPDYPLFGEKKSEP